MNQTEDYFRCAGGSFSGRPAVLFNSNKVDYGGIGAGHANLITVYNEADPGDAVATYPYLRQTCEPRHYLDGTKQSSLVCFILSLKFGYAAIFCSDSGDSRHIPANLATTQKWTGRSGEKLHSQYVREAAVSAVAFCPGGKSAGGSLHLPSPHFLSINPLSARYPIPTQEPGKTLMTSWALQVYMNGGER
ncbi:hypothetical protein EVAR_39324_1 [Eumeta japonica]|uniref:Uncharacterized protein n=1 Tax=Eumeta variegata TaxID=151549 RepID=A0A4C1WMU5_EUMVA|nr:hypothetical protein EVAR_39324_1 [Eumeta japonica]